MIYTVTLNPAIDKTAEIADFATGTVNRIASVREDAGGKGINVSKCLKALGAESVCAVILAGDAGSHLAELLEKEGLNTLYVTARGQTRTNLKIIDPQRGENTDINEPGPEIEEAVLQQLLDKLRERIEPNDIVVLSGSLPKGAPVDTYRVWTQQFSHLGAKVFLDADGACMASGIQGKPYLVKPNEAELSRVLGRPLQTKEALLSGGKELLAMGISNVVVSMGADGALFLWEDAAYQAKALKVPVLSTVGAGDSVVAAMAYGLEKKLSREAQISLAMAMGGASVMRSGSQAPEMQTVYELKDKVVAEKL